MRPTEFWVQANRITTGMTINDVRGALKGVTREIQTSGTIRFVMEPMRPPEFSVPLAVNLYINVTLDERGLVKAVGTSDG